MKRIFIALKVEPEEPLLLLISLLQNGLKDDRISWTNPNNIHITLAFLGDTENDKVSLISSLLHERCSGYGKFDLILRGAGVFKNMNDPRIIWTGVEAGENLIKLFNLISGCLKDAGIMIEERTFKPHLTMGRIKTLRDKAVLSDILDKYKDHEIQRVPVGEVILYESILLPAGPLYKPLSKIIM